MALNRMPSSRRLVSPYAVRPPPSPFLTSPLPLPSSQAALRPSYGILTAVPMPRRWGGVFFEGCPRGRRA